MGKPSIVDRIVQSLAFEVEAVPQDDPAKSTSAQDNTPINLKIRVRKTDAGVLESAVLSVPKLGQAHAKPERVRLISSDQTIMSFIVSMEADFAKKPKRKLRRSFFGRCLGTQYDDDETPYAPSVYSAMMTDADGSIASKSDGVLKQHFTLAKTKYDNTDSLQPYTKKYDILGICKPGGCLDPPFGEEKYSYEPLDQTKRKVSNTDKDATKTKKKLNLRGSSMEPKKSKDNVLVQKTIVKIKDDSILSIFETNSLKGSMDSQYSDSIMTYPPGASSSVTSNNKYLRTRVTSEEKQKKSFDESIEAFFSSPKKNNRFNEQNKNEKNTKPQSNLKKNALRRNNDIPTLKPITIAPKISSEQDLSKNNSIRLETNSIFVTPMMAIQPQNNLEKMALKSNIDNSNLKQVDDDADEMDSKFNEDNVPSVVKTEIDDDPALKNLYFNSAVYSKNNDNIAATPQVTNRGSDNDVSSTEGSVFLTQSINVTPQAGETEINNPVEVETAANDDKRENHLDTDKTVAPMTTQSGGINATNNVHTFSITQDVFVTPKTSETKTNVPINVDSTEHGFDSRDTNSLVKIGIMVTSIDSLTKNDGNNTNTLGNEDVTSSLQEVDMLPIPGDLVLPSEKTANDDDLAIKDFNTTDSVIPKEFDVPDRTGNRASLDDNNFLKIEYNVSKTEHAVNEPNHTVTPDRQMGRGNSSKPEIIKMVAETNDTSLNQNITKSVDEITSGQNNVINNDDAIKLNDSRRGSRCQNENVITKKDTGNNKDTEHTWSVGAQNDTKDHNSLNNSGSHSFTKKDSLIIQAQTDVIHNYNKPFEASITNDSKTGGESPSPPDKMSQIINSGQFDQHSLMNELNDSRRGSRYQSENVFTKNGTGNNKDIEHTLSVGSQNDTKDHNSLNNSGSHSFTKKDSLIIQAQTDVIHNYNKPSEASITNDSKTGGESPSPQDKISQIVNNGQFHQHSLVNNDPKETFWETENSVSSDRKMDEYFLANEDKTNYNTDLLTPTDEIDTQITMTEEKYKVKNGKEPEKLLNSLSDNENISSKPTRGKTYNNSEKYDPNVRLNDDKIKTYSNAQTSHEIIIKDKSLENEAGYQRISTHHKSKTGQASPSLSKYQPNNADRSASRVDSYQSARGSKSSLKRDTVRLDLAFQSYVNDKKERTLKSVDTLKEPIRYPNDAVTVIQSHIRPQVNEIRIPVDSENDMTIQIKRAVSPTRRVQIIEERSTSKSDPKKYIKTVEEEYESLNNRNSSDTHAKQMWDELVNNEIQKQLKCIHDQQLLPLQSTIKNLKQDIELLLQQRSLSSKKSRSSMPFKQIRSVRVNSRCGCRRK